MSLEGSLVRGPTVDFKIIRGPSGITAADLRSHLVSFEFDHPPKRKRTKKKRPRIVMEFDNSDGKILNDAVPLVGLVLQLSWGYPNNKTKLFNVVVRRIVAQVVRDAGGKTLTPAPNAYGLVTMECSAHNLRMHLTPRNAGNTFKNVTIAEIARQIARRAGYKENRIFIQDTNIDGKPFERIDEVIIPAHETDELFLQRKASEVGFDFDTTKREFHFAAPSEKVDTSEEISFFRGPDLLEFNVDGDFRMSVTNVTGKTFNPRFGVTRVFSADRGQLGVIHDTHTRKSSPLNDLLSRRDVVPTVVSQVSNRARTRLANHIRDEWRVQMKIVGNPRCFVGTLLNLSNFGPYVDGKWYIEGAKHTINSDGYTTSLTLRGRYGAAKRYVIRIERIFNGEGLQIGVRHILEPIQVKTKRKKRSTGKRTTRL